MNVDDLLRIKASPRAEATAFALCRTRLVHVRLDAPPPAPGAMVWLRSICSLDLWTSSSSAAPPLVEEQLAQWASRSLELALYDVASFGTDRLVEEIYFPLFVRHAYCTGDASFPMNLDTFRRLALPDLPLAVATENGAVVAACLLQPTSRTPTAVYSAPELREDGLDLVAMATVDPDLGDAFFFACLQMLEAHEYGSVRVRRAPWISRGSVASFLRDLTRADRLAWEEREPGDYFFVDRDAVTAGAGAIVLERIPGGIRPVFLGAASAGPWRDVERELRRLVERGSC